MYAVVGVILFVHFNEHCFRWVGLDCLVLRFCCYLAGIFLASPTLSLEDSLTSFLAEFLCLEPRMVCSQPTFPSAFSIVVSYLRYRL
jgi:hypothetical protein